MKILHTADWHIGKQLYKYSLDQELNLFFKWLIHFIETEKIDVLLISGDIFDLANPSHHSRKMYYSVLKSLIGINVKVIITGGNHDSITNLDASSELLALLDIKVVGGVPEKLEDVLIDVKVAGEQVIIAAIPFIRDKDLRRGDGVIRGEDRIQATQLGILEYYQRASERIKAMNGSHCKSIAMGHLYMQSAKTSESERDIQIGNLAGIESASMATLFDYVALGHIHRPQSFAEGKIRYSGSPISLSFSEREDAKQIVVVTLDGGEIAIEPVLVPKFRELIKITGTLEQVKEKMSAVKSDKELPPFVEIEVTETDYSIPMIEASRKFIDSKQSADFVIVKDRITFENSPRSLTSLAPTVEIGDLKPIDVFERKLDSEGINEAQKEALKVCFYELLEEAFEGDK